MTFKPIEEGLEQYHFIVAVIYKGITIITSQRLKLKSLKHSETCTLNSNGYKDHCCVNLKWYNKFNTIFLITV